MAPNRSSFAFIFTATLAAVFFIVTGLIGYQPPANLSLDLATWRRGVWSDGVILTQVALGVALLMTAGIVALRINRRLATADELMRLGVRGTIEPTR